MVENRLEIVTNIKLKAKALGFSECRIIPVESLIEEKEHLKLWLENGMHGVMSYMSRNTDKRIDPGLLVENAKTMIVVLQNYFTRQSQTDPDAPVVSKYAYGEDYHLVIKPKLRALLGFVQHELKDCTGRVFVDSAPVLERTWARKAGLGWIGKNSNLISIEHGSFFFIGEIIIDKELFYDEGTEISDHCGRCTRCIDACPTNAIVGSRIVDARKCISYQTIELKEAPDINLKGLFRNRVFGCDICQDVCPWNQKSVTHDEPSFIPDPKLIQMEKQEWDLLEEDSFNELFSHSSLKRIGIAGMKRNLAFLELK